MSHTYLVVNCKTAGCQAVLKLEELAGGSKDAYFPKPSYSEKLKCLTCGQPHEYNSEDLKSITTVEESPSPH